MTRTWQDVMDCLSSEAGDCDNLAITSSQIPVRKPSPSGSWGVEATSQKTMNRRGKSQNVQYVDANGAMDQVLASRTKAVAGLKFKKPEDNTPDISAPKTWSSQTPKPPASKKPPSPVLFRTYTSGTNTRTSEVENAARPPEPTAGPTKPRSKPKPVLQGGGSKDASSSIGKKTGPSWSQPSSTQPALNMLSMDITPTPSRPSQRQKERPQSRIHSQSDSPGSEKIPAKKVAFPTISPFTTRVTKVQRLVEFPDSSPLGDLLDDEPRKRDLPKKSLGAPVLREFPPIHPISIASPQRNPKAAGLDVHKGKTKTNDTKGKPKAEKRMAICDSEGEPREYDSDHWLSKKKDGKSAVPKRKLAAFSTSTQALADIDLSPERPIPWSPSRSVKRSSEGGNGDEHLSKKPKQIQEHLSSTQRSLGNPSFEDGESISLKPEVDPKSLCPYCDSHLPSSPSRLLLRLLSTTRLKSYKDARPSNPLGRKAPLAVFATVCQRHRFESKILPEAERKGWPKTIDWKKIEGRIGRMKGQLQALIRREGDDSDENMPDGWQVLHGGTGGRSEKVKSVFWDEVLEEIKKKGLKSIAGVQGQFDNFKKAQPGYYGELGSVIIYQTLYNMFPPADVDAANVAPLTISQFVQRVLVPEVALRLIMEDQRLKGDSGMRQALAILRDSSAYGVAMFPDDNYNADKLGVGDMIVMERARKRRKELEEEEERERDEKQERLQEALEQAKKKGKVRTQKDMQQLKAEDMAPRLRPRPKPRAVTRSLDGMDESSTDTDVKPSIKATAQPCLSRNRTRSKVRSMQLNYSDGSTSTEEETKKWMKDIPPAIPLPNLNLKRSPSASETRDKHFGSDLAGDDFSPPAIPLPNLNIERSPSASETRDKHFGSDLAEDDFFPPAIPLPNLNIERSPSASETRDKHFGSDLAEDDFFDQFDDTPRRAPSPEVAAMDISASDPRGNASAKAKPKARVAASSPTRSSSRKSLSKRAPLKTHVAIQKGRQRAAYLGRHA